MLRRMLIKVFGRGSKFNMFYVDSRLGLLFILNYCNDASKVQNTISLSEVNSVWIDFCFCVCIVSLLPAQRFCHNKINLICRQANFCIYLLPDLLLSVDHSIPLMSMPNILANVLMLELMVIEYNTER